MLLDNATLDPQEVKKRSEKIILNAGGEILSWLPTLDIPKPRSQNEIINRALVLNAIYQLHLKAPKYYIADWIEEHFLISSITPQETIILSSPNELTEEEHYKLFWSLESLWAIAWATSLIPELPFNQLLGNLAAISPNLQLNEGADKYATNMQLRSTETIYEMLDLYYRLHWWVHTSKNMNKPTGDIQLEVITARRKALEWILDNTAEWDRVDLSI